jgi:RNA polymerase sigma factor (sigma-70 family)
MSNDYESQPVEHTVTRAIRDYKELESSVAANLIVERLESRVLALARKRANNKKIRNDVADLVQKSFIKLFKQLKDEEKRDKITDSESLWSVLANILKQTTVDELRKIYAKSRGGSGRQTSQRPFGNFLIEKGLITKEQLDTVLKEQTQAPNKTLEDLLVDNGIVSRGDLDRVLLQHLPGHKVQDRQAIEKSFDQFSAKQSPQKPLGQYLIEKALITEEQLDKQLEEQKQTVNDVAEEIVARVVQFIESLDDPTLLTILRGKVDGRSNEDIGESLGVSRESVRRKYKMIKELAAEQFGQ